MSPLRWHVDDGLALLALQPVASVSTDSRVELIWLTVHTIGLTMLWTVFQFPLSAAIALALVSVGVLLVPQIVASLRTRRLQLQVGILAPLFIAYALILLRLSLKYVLVWKLPTYAPGDPLDPLAALLTSENILLAAVAYVALIQLAQWTRDVWQHAAGYLIVALTFGWAMWEYVGHRTAGVTASDQYAYAQMAVDWVRRGTPLHAFPLFERVYALNIPYFAGVHVGYRLPLENLRVAPSVWPPGVSLFLAVAYRALGEGGLYIVAPLFGLAVLWLMWLVARRSPHPHAVLVAGLSVLLLATSFEQVDRLLVPMADVPSQFFSLAAVALALFAPHTTRRTWLFILIGLLAGGALGLAYWIRHTQVLVGVALLVAVLFAWRDTTWRARVTFLAPCVVAALIAALPDLVYHQQVFGNVLHVESEELQYFSADAVGVALKRLWDDFALGHEFGFIWLLTLLGAVQMARAQFRTFAVLFVWVATLFAFHVPYAALRLRDLMGEFPPLMLWTAWGAVSLLSVTTDVRKARRQHALTIAVILFVLVALSLRTQTTLARTLSPHRAGFGYMLPDERAAFNRLAELTPANAVFALTLHSGAVDLYAQRATVRPNVWSAAELDRFLDLMRSDGRPVFLLYDSPDLRPHLNRLRAAGRLERVAQFVELTFFGEREAEAGTLYRVSE